MQGRSVWPRARERRFALIAGVLSCASCQSAPEPSADRSVLIARGEQLFFEETFDGNGRTCGTCHRREDNFGLSPAFIATLPDDDPLFVAERQRALRVSFENPDAMRQFGLILENRDGFDGLDSRSVLRGIPHLLALSVSVDSADGPRTGWGGDGAPGDGSLRAFAVGAIIQHFPRTLNRIAGVDFRLPDDGELDALEAFLLSLGRQQDLSLPLPLIGEAARRGQEIFVDDQRGKCNVCHFNAGANAREGIFGTGAGNRNFNTGLPDGPGNPTDDGFGIPGSGEFNTPPLVEAADTAPFFHNNSVDSLEAAVAFYNTPAFNESPSGQMLRAETGGGIALDAESVNAVAAFLRVINALENIRTSLLLLEDVRGMANLGMEQWRVRLDQAWHETEDALEVLDGSGLHPRAVSSLQRALARLDDARQRRGRTDLGAATREATAELGQARADLVAGREAP
jgi:mono/diheme cytochrome c family protein